MSFADKPRGLVLVTGPTGSGKSTTLASIIDVINQTREDHIMTIEDPIEFLHNHKKCIVNQRELGFGRDVSFAEALKAALRQDPDVILVGEMRDIETISTAITAAETGHLVFATLHTQDARADDRPHRRRPSPPEQQGQIRAQLVDRPAGDRHPDVGADRGRRRPRASPLRCMMPTPAVRNLIREAKTHQLYSVAPDRFGQFGMQTMDASLAQPCPFSGQDHEGGGGGPSSLDRGAATAC